MMAAVRREKVQFRSGAALAAFMLLGFTHVQAQSSPSSLVESRVAGWLARLPAAAVVRLVSEQKGCFNGPMDVQQRRRLVSVGASEPLLSLLESIRCYPTAAPTAAPSTGSASFRPSPRMVPLELSLVTGGVAAVRVEDGSSAIELPVASWISTDTAVAVVRAGVVRGVAPGTAYVLAQVAGQAAPIAATVTVTPAAQSPSRIARAVPRPPDGFVLATKDVCMAGTVRCGDEITGVLGSGREVTLPLNITRTGAYRISGSCDPECKDLDLSLSGPMLTALGDFGSSATPAVEPTVQVAGVHRIRVYMARCEVSQCSFALRVYARIAGDNFTALPVPGSGNENGAPPSDRVIETGSRLVEFDGPATSATNATTPLRPRARADSLVRLLEAATSGQSTPFAALVEVLAPTREDRRLKFLRTMTEIRAARGSIEEVSEQANGLVMVAIRLKWRGPFGGESMLVRMLVDPRKQTLTANLQSY